jgi:hypothetical protein
MVEYFNGTKNIPIGFIFFPVLGVIFLFIGISGLMYCTYTKKDNGNINNYKTIFFIIFSLFSAFWLALALIAGIITPARYIKIYNNKEYKIIEGTVENFEPEHSFNHKYECFTVDGVKFNYSTYTITFRFNKTRSHEGPIRNGIYVRIYYIGDTIIGLWVKNTRAS